MEAFKINDDCVEIVLTPNDVESAIRQFICTCKPEFNTKWILDSKYSVQTVVFSGTKK